MSLNRYEKFEGEKLVGIISWKENEIRILSVEKEFRRKPQKYGSNLLREAEKDIKKNYICALVLVQPTEDNDSEIAREELKTFYRKNGYNEFPWIKRYLYGISENIFTKCFADEEKKS
jgi:ribosomal protein S18 acetylase RimI-like enzyme